MPQELTVNSFCRRPSQLPASASSSSCFFWPHICTHVCWELSRAHPRKHTAALLCAGNHPGLIHASTQLHSCVPGPPRGHLRKHTAALLCAGNHPGVICASSTCSFLLSQLFGPWKFCALFQWHFCCLGFHIILCDLGRGARSYNQDSYNPHLAMELKLDLNS